MRTTTHMEKIDDLGLRPQVIEKTIYEPMLDVEQFIVPLLKEHINRFLSVEGRPLKDNSRVLDAGCGGQPFRENLETLGYNYISTDVNQNPDQSVDVLCKMDGDISDKLLELGSFDLIFCTEVMEHVADWDKAFSNFSHLLNLEGKLFITCPHFYPLHEVPYDFWRPTPYALQYFANKHGLTVLRQENAGDAWDIIGTILGSLYSAPASNSFQDRLFNYIVRHCHQFLFKLLRDRTIQKSVQLRSAPYLPSVLYMSNVLICQKQS
jgi:SAM-dependent methyltransferase